MAQPQKLKTVQKSDAKSGVKAPLKEGLPVRMLIPNMVTIAGLCAGVSAIRFAIIGDFNAAIFAIDRKSVV